MSESRILVVCHAHPEFSLGGAEISAHAHWMELRERGIPAMFLARSSESEGHIGAPFSARSADGMEVLFSVPPVNHFRHSQPQGQIVFESFRQLLESFRPTAVHFHHYVHLGLELIREVRHYRPDISITLTLHEYLAICHAQGQMLKTNGRLCHKAAPLDCHLCFPDISPQDFFMRELFVKSFFDLVDHFVCPSIFLRDRYLSWGLPAEKMVVLENGQPRRNSEEARGSTNNIECHFAILGQLSYLKGTLVALDAIRLLPRSVRSKVRLEIHGSFQHASEDFKRQLETGLKGLEHIVQMCGPYKPEQTTKILQSNGWLIVPSIWWENSPLVIQEAFAAGRPVICSDIGGMAEKVLDGVSGLHFRVSDPADLASRIEQCVSQPALWEELRKNLPQPLSVVEAVDRLIPLYETRTIPISEPDLWNDYALAARDRGDLAEAARRWTSMRLKIPNHPVGYAHGIATLRELGRLDEAEPVCELALTLFPEDSRFWNEWAMIASERHELKLAARRWQEMLLRFPDLPEAYTRTAMILRDIGQMDEAEKTMKEGVTRFPNNPEIAIQYAWGLYLRKGWKDENPGCWDEVRLHFPDHPEGYSMSCNALMRIGHLDDAEALSEQAVKLFPADFGVLRSRADLATRRRDWPEAIHRWKELQARYPEADGVSSGIDILRNTIELEKIEQGDPDLHSDHKLDRVAPGITERVSLKTEVLEGLVSRGALEYPELLSRFESLGETCEFGIVQRIGGASTLGLLRYCSIQPKQLIAALDSQFDGVGSLEHTFLSVNEAGEYILNDRRYFEKHTFTFVDDKQTNADKFLRRACHWLTLLRNKLIEDLGKSEKIFVYKPSPLAVLEDADAMEIWRAVRRYGANTVLCVRLQDALHSAGTVDRIEEGLLFGYVDRHPTSMDLEGVSYDCWISVCRLAAELSDLYKHPSSPG